MLIYFYKVYLNHHPGDILHPVKSFFFHKMRTIICLLLFIPKNGLFYAVRDESCILAIPNLTIAMKNVTNCLKTKM